MSSKEFMEAHNGLVRLEQALNDARNLARKYAGFGDQRDKITRLTADVLDLTEERDHARTNAANNYAAFSDTNDELVKIKASRVEFANRVDRLERDLQEAREQGSKYLLEYNRRIDAEENLAAMTKARDNYKEAYEEHSEKLKAFKLPGWNGFLTRDEAETIIALRKGKCAVIPLPETVQEVIAEIDKMVAKAREASQVPLGGAVRTDRVVTGNGSGKKLPPADMDTELGARWEGKEPSKRVPITSRRRDAFEE